MTATPVENADCHEMRVGTEARPYLADRSRAPGVTQAQKSHSRAEVVAKSAQRTRSLRGLGSALLKPALGLNCPVTRHTPRFLNL